MQNESKRRLFKNRIAIALLGIMLCTPSLSLGWGAGGHMMVASIAFKRLNPHAKAQAIPSQRQRQIGRIGGDLQERACAAHQLGEQHA